MTATQMLLTGAKIAGAVAAMILLILWMSGFFGTKIPPGTVAAEATLAPEGAVTATVEESEVPVVEEAAGTVQAERKTVISSRIVAAIAEVLVRTGDQVNQGDPLVVLDDRELTARALEAQRAADSAEAARRRAASDFQRAKELLAKKVVSQSEFDQAQSAAQVASADLSRAQEALRGAHVAVSYARIASPVAGRVTDRFADPGDTAMPGKPLIGLYDPAALRMEVPVRESMVTRLSVGQTVQVRLGSAADVIDGTVDEIVPQAEAGSRTFLVKVGLPKRQGVYTGMFGRVGIPAGTRHRLLVPAAAVERVGQLDFVSVVGPDRTLARRLVTLGPDAGGGRVEVLSGLRAGEMVLLASGPPEQH